MVFPHGEIVLHRIAIDKASDGTGGLRCSTPSLVDYRGKILNRVHKIRPFYPTVAFDC